MTPADEMRAAADRWRRTHPDDELAHSFATLLDDLAHTGNPRALNAARHINHTQES